jgi:hypothetical protein
LRDTGRSTRHGKAVWECECECGKKIFTTAYLLCKGETKSCGCLGRSDYGVRANDIYRGYLKQAAKKKREFSLSIDDFYNLSQQNCHYCGQTPSNGANWRQCGDIFVYNGIDRVDNSKGYTKDNCVPCCKQCNRAKGTLNISEFACWIETIVERIHDWKDANVSFG